MYHNYLAEGWEVVTGGNVDDGCVVLHRDGKFMGIVYNTEMSYCQAYPIEGEDANKYKRLLRMRGAR